MNKSDKNILIEEVAEILKSKITPFKQLSLDLCPPRVLSGYLAWIAGNIPQDPVIREKIRKELVKFGLIQGLTIRSSIEQQLEKRKLYMRNYMKNYVRNSQQCIKC